MPARSRMTAPTARPPVPPAGSRMFAPWTAIDTVTLWRGVVRRPYAPWKAPANASVDAISSSSAKAIQPGSADAR